MFEQTVLATSSGHRLFGTFAGVTFQALFIGSLILVPLVFPQVLPQMQSLVSLVAPGPPPPPPPPLATVRPRGTVAPHLFRCAICAPVSIPMHAIQIVDDLPDAAPGETVGVVGGFGDGVPGGMLPDFLRSLPAAVPPPRPAVAEPVKPAAPAAIPRYRVGGVVQPATLIHRVDPQYPPLARQARISGTVELEGVIGIDGRVHELKVKSGHPLLIKAALDAVSQWLYRPTTLNSQPVEVIMPVTVTFRLN